jgi:hypothetical protein
MRVVAGTLAGVLLLAGCASLRHQHPRASGTIGGAIAVSVFYGSMQAVEKGHQPQYYAVGALAGAVVGYVAGWEYERSEPERYPSVSFDVPIDEPASRRRRRWDPVDPPDPPPPPLTPAIDAGDDDDDGDDDASYVARSYELTYDLESPALGADSGPYRRGGHGVATTIARACADALLDATEQLRGVCVDDWLHAGVASHAVAGATCACTATGPEQIECGAVVEASCQLSGTTVVLGVGSNDSKTVAQADAIADARARCVMTGGTPTDVDTSCHCDNLDWSDWIDSDTADACSCLAQASCDP